MTVDLDQREWLYLRHLMSSELRRLRIASARGDAWNQAEVDLLSAIRDKLGGRGPAAS